jgi:hypothetical protein
VTVVRGLAVQRPEKIQLLDDVGRAEIEVLRHEPLGDSGVAGAEGIDLHGHRLGAPDGVRHLDLGTFGEARLHDPARDIAAVVGAAAIDLRRILAAECAATMPSGAAVRVDDDFPAGDAAVGRRAAEREAAARVHDDLGVGGVPLAERSRRQHFLDVIADVGLADVTGVLS